MTNLPHTCASTLPVHILLDKWADIGFFWQGEMNPEVLPRLADILHVVDNVAPLHISVRLTKDNGILYLNYDVAGVLPLSCQRCLSPLCHDVTGSYRTALLSDERELSSVGDDDYLLILELGADNRLPIRDLLEDELLLALPLSPRHDDCQMLTDSVGDAPEDKPKANPFAVLEALKGKN